MRPSFKKARILMILLIGGTSSYTPPAFSAEASFNIRVRLVRCVSEEERRTMCQTENMCCEYINSGDFAAYDNDPSIDEPIYVTLNTFAPPSESNIWMRSVSRKQTAP